jgi:hypothetical protein
VLTESNLRFAELPLLAAAGNLQLTMHDTNTETTTLYVNEKHGGIVTLKGEDEAEAVDIAELPPRVGSSLENAWRINPDQLKCRRKPDGELWKLGQGGILYSACINGKLAQRHVLINSKKASNGQAFCQILHILGHIACISVQASFLRNHDQVLGFSLKEFVSLERS